MSAATSPLSPSRLQAQYPKLRLPASTDPPSETNPSTPKVWVVFGATGHIGRSLVRGVLSHGDVGHSPLWAQRCSSY
ncbi:hypothetical protein M433DRAFT_175983 [Acidomyces richmondensis BFW]|nr:hypothetical protein M433DRAFT_175983 [Acidomyces richmondensis BFW]